MGFFAPIIGLVTKVAPMIGMVSKVAGMISGGGGGGDSGAAAMARYNQQVAMRDAAQVRRASLAEQSARRDEMRRHLSERRAKYAKAGVTMAGSPLETQLETIEIYEEDIANLTWEYDIQARRATSRAGIESFKAKRAERAGKIGVGQHLISTIGDIAKMGLSGQLG